MYKFYSTADMLQQYEESGWRRKNNGRGFSLELPPELGTGYMEIWGDPASHCCIDSNMVLNREMVERYYYTERGLKITFIEDMTGSYYQSKDTSEEALFGTFCTVCNLPRPWFHRYPAGTKQKCFSIVICESFLNNTGIIIPSDDWDRAAYIINGRNNKYPELAALCREISRTSVSDKCFPMYFHGKAVEATALIFNAVYKMGSKEMDIITPKSRLAVKRAIHILNEKFAHTPVIDELAKMVEVDPKTLQKGFQQTVGQTIHQYVRAIRMERALTYLEDKTLNTDDIARLTGYQSKVHFFRAFKEIYGCTPNTMRTGEFNLRKQ